MVQSKSFGLGWVGLAFWASEIIVVPKIQNDKQQQQYSTKEKESFHSNYKSIIKFAKKLFFIFCSWLFFKTNEKLLRDESERDLVEVIEKVTDNKSMMENNFL